MIKSVKVTNHLGESLSLDLKSPDNMGLFIRGIEGLGPSKSNVNISEGAGVDGGFFNSARLNVRNLVFSLGFYNWGSDSIETIRQRTYRYFPMKRPIQIEVETDNRIAKIEGYVESNEPNIFSNSEGTNISVLCPDPHFYALNPSETIFNGTQSLFEFPFENASLTESLIEFGSIFLDTQKSVYYEGDEPVGVTITISILGNVNNITIYNLSTNETFPIVSARITAITGSNLVAGDVVTLSTVRNNKYLRLTRAGVTYNILGAAGSTATWFQLQPGDNLFAYVAASGQTLIQFRVDNNIAYGGI